MIQNKKTNSERRRDYYLRIWGLDENNSLTDQHRFTKQYPPEPYYLPKTRFLKDWNWQQKFNSLEKATEFLLNYCTELGPLSRECLQRLNKNAETIRQLTNTNKKLRRSLLPNDYTQKDRQE